MASTNEINSTGTYPAKMPDLLRKAVERKASDLHLMEGQPPALRVALQLERMELPALSSEQVKELTYSILQPEQVRIFEQERELDFSYYIPGISRFRGNMMVQKGTISAVYRIVPLSIPEFGALGLPQNIRELCGISRGLILVTGPTGSGKSTTVAAMIDFINRTRSLNIVTIEDPMEFMHTYKGCFIRQRQVGSDTHSFHNALVKALRHDPDVIQIGEMRDRESISIALTAAETGHLVISTLHTQTASLSIHRIVDVFPANSKEQIRSQLADSMRAIVSQKLLPRNKDNGKVLAVEVIMDVPAVKNLIREGKEHQLYSIIQTHAGSGMQTMDRSIFNLYITGEISKETALEYCIDHKEMERMMSKGF